MRLVLRIDQLLRRLAAGRAQAGAFVSRRITLVEFVSPFEDSESGFHWLWKSA